MSRSVHSMGQGFLVVGLGFGGIGVQAGVNSDLHDFFNGLGYASNVTGPTAYQGQQAGYYTGGSISLKNRVRETPIWSVTLPSVSAGCGGIDAYLGGFSFINGAGIQELMQNIMHGAIGFVTELALEKAIPLTTNVLRHMQGITIQSTEQSINSCEAAIALVGAVGLQHQKSQQNVCASAAMSLHIVGSWGEAVKTCQDPAQYRAVMQRASQKGSAYGALITDPINVTWAALQRHPFYAHDTEHAELLMALSGTIIVEEGKESYWRSYAQDGNLISALLHGGEAPLYRCDKQDTCLHPTVGRVRIQPANALEARVKRLLESMQAKIFTETPLNTEEIAFLQSTHLPLYKMLNVQAAYGGGASVLDVTEYSGFIAQDLVYRYLEESIHEVEAAAQSLQLDPAMRAAFAKGLGAALTTLHQKTITGYPRLQAETAMIARTRSAEQMLAGELVSQWPDLQNMQGGGGASS